MRIRGWGSGGLCRCGCPKFAAGKFFSDSPCQGLGIFQQGEWLLENPPRLRERSWIFSSETATAFLSFSDTPRAENDT